VLSPLEPVCVHTELFIIRWQTLALLIDVHKENMKPRYFLLDWALMD